MARIWTPLRSGRARVGASGTSSGRACAIFNDRMRTPAPLIAIIGRPNVGKSALFNRLIGQRRSIVTDEPGITRDRIYGQMDWSGRTFEIVDTGGITPGEETEIPALIYEQAQVAIEEASIIYFVVDARTDITAQDQEL